MSLTTQNESLHAGGFLVSELDKTGSRDKAVLISGQANLKAGTVLGKIANATSAPASAPNAGNTGNGVMGAITASAGVKVGVYTLEITTAATNAGEFDVYDPNGDHVGQGKVGVAFSAGGLAFTLADGGTDFVVGDGFTITVSANAGAGKFAICDPAATDGSQNAAAILFADADATTADVAITIVDSNCEVNASELVWKSGMTTNQKNAALAQLLLLGIKAR